MRDNIEMAFEEAEPDLAAHLLASNFSETAL
jgi:hypothetical protein